MSTKIRARIVDKNELRKPPAERQAELLLAKLDADKAIEVSLDSSSARTIRRLFSKAAGNLGLDIQLRTKDGKVYVLLRQPKAGRMKQTQ